MQQIDPCHPCGNPPSPCPPLPPGGFLMQQIVASGRVYLRYQRFSLCLDGLPCGSQPMQLTDVRADPCGVRVERRGCDCRGMIPVCLHVPLCCGVCAGCQQLTASACIEIPMQLRLFGDPREADRAVPAASVYARLARPGCVLCENTADVWLDVWAEAWLTACRPLYGGCCPPACPPPLPLYPQPCRMR